EHLDHYGTFDKVRDGFKQFVESIPFYGFATLCIDHPEVQAMIGRITDRRVITYGFSPQADVRAVNVTFDNRGATYDVQITDRTRGTTDTITGIHLPMFGRHNVQNSLVVAAIAKEMGFSGDVVKKALGGFGGVKRRFTITGTAGGITVVDDYGHHPVEISAVLSAARLALGDRPEAKVIAVVQPHRYTRLRDLFEDFCSCFNDADTVIVTDVYAAGEAPIEGVSRDALVEGLRNRGHRRVLALQAPEQLAELAKQEASAGDLVVCLGAGNITSWANALPGELQALYDKGPA
ncbi:MAG: UDP-N-acetylmuramate--L-alanine ligase, partial [Ferrovibrio sp.]